MLTWPRIRVTELFRSAEDHTKDERTKIKGNYHQSSSKLDWKRDSHGKLLLVAQGRVFITNTEDALFL